MKRTIIDKDELDKKILLATAINILPHHYQYMYKKKGLEMFEDQGILKKLRSYGINVEELKQVIIYSTK